MKKYNHKPVTLEPIKATNKDGVRLYETPDGNKYPSITTVLSVRNKQGLFEWRKRVGEDVANYIARTAAARGTAVHHMCEDYLNNEDMEKHKKNFLPHALFTQMRDNLLHRIDNIYSQSAYAEMFEERTGIEINQICILVVTQDGVVQEFVKDKKEYLPLLIETISQWEERNEISINSITNMDNVATV